jgi:short-subunit dehydrogenase
MEPICPTMQGKVCLVTGVINGIGPVKARELAHGAHVILVGRSQACCETAVEQLLR